MRNAFGSFGALRTIAWFASCRVAFRLRLRPGGRGSARFAWLNRRLRVRLRRLRLRRRVGLLRLHRSHRGRFGPFFNPLFSLRFNLLRPRESSRGEFLFAQSRRFARIDGRARPLPRVAQQVVTQLSQLLLRVEGFIGGLRLARLIGT
nr:hypothetical protein [Caballeronia sp. J97]